MTATTPKGVVLRKLNAHKRRTYRVLRFWQPEGWRVAVRTSARQEAHAVREGLNRRGGRTAPPRLESGMG